MVIPTARVRGLLPQKTFFEDYVESALVSLAMSLEDRDPFSPGHCERVSSYSVRLGQSLGLPDAELAALQTAGIVHDVGKVAVPEEIMMKPGPLTQDEVEIMREHAVVGERLCAGVKSFRGALPLIRHHHERMDGSGYPGGLKGGEIPLGARIIQTVDIYDALTSDRPYRRAFSPREAFRIMYAEVERGWCDGALVDLLEGMKLRQAERSPVFGAVKLRASKAFA
jgi:putative two-component system response regulator